MNKDDIRLSWPQHNYLIDSWDINSLIKNIYELSTYSQNFFYYEARIDYEKLLEYCDDNVILLSGDNEIIDTGTF